jgi:hypothetical protein
VPDAGPGKFYAVSVPAAVAKVKDLLVGLPPTDAEVKAVATDNGALKALVGRWMTLPQYRTKMLRFFVREFQQDQFVFSDLTFQFHGLVQPGANGPQLIQNMQESFARTAMAIIDEGKPFTATMTTTRYMMTPALMAAYALLDGLQIDDHYMMPDALTTQPGVKVVVEDSAPTGAESNKGSGVITFFDPSLATSYARGCPTGSITYPAPAPTFALASILLTSYVPVPGRPDCMPPNVLPSAEVLHDTDYTNWQMVSIQQSSGAKPPVPFYDLATLRSAHELSLRIPRVSFFTTPAFNARWQTNDSNQARVVLNQLLIVGLGHPVDYTNTTQIAPRTRRKSPDSALDQSRHAKPGSLCYKCHQSLDPMRQILRQTYTLYMSRQENPYEGEFPGDFGFHDVSATAPNVSQLADLLASHPLFAPAWVQKLCTYATSSPCDENDPEFTRLVELFKSSHYSWSALVQALFSSPMVTFLKPTRSATAGETFPIRLQEHLCATLSSRLHVDDLCGLDARTQVPSRVVRTLAQSWPSGQYSRGNQSPALAVGPALLTRGGMESLCADLANYFVDPQSPETWASSGPEKPLVLNSADSANAIHALAAQLMGLTGERAAGPESVLEEHFAAAMKAGFDPSASMKSTFVLACISPYVAGVGQ